MPKQLTNWQKKWLTMHGVVVKKDKKKVERYKRRILRILEAHPRAVYDLSRFVKEFRIREHTLRGGLCEFFDAIDELEVAGTIDHYPHPKFEGIKAYRINKEKPKPT